ncbi:mucin-22-like isoform X3 [Mytilus californianus]|uniref:mucin-22-like isoform X3 n=1 Tax=Mytilus californianus TaxID=6549 RepID=UPI0022472B67|nr:mucin-22-like isoform X3 [Mytilus californianus]
MMFDRQFTDEYIKKKWPKITLPLANTRKNDPFVPGIVDEGSITIDEKSGTHDHKVRNTLCVIGLGTLLLCLVGAAIITIALLADQRTDKTDYVKVNMTVAINQTFTPELNDTESTEYKTFATKFCSEMENVYASKSSSVDGYFGCKVIQLTDGSIIVNYVIYFISTTNQQVTTDTISTTLITHLTVSGTQLGSLVVITSTIIVHDVATETLESPPAVDKIATTTTIKSTIETTTKENVPSTETTPASETVQQTEATTLKTMQSTAETTSLTISSTKETTPNTQSTTEISTPFISSTEETTPKNMQSTTDNSTPTITSTGDTTSKTMQSTTETTTRLITSPGETTPKTVQSTTETTTPSISSTADTTPKTVQSTTETTTPSISSTDETTQKNMQSTTKTATPTMSSTEKTTPKTIQSTTDTTTPLITAADETTPKNMQSTTETTNPSILSTDDTTPKNMQSTTKTTTPSISSTEKTTPKIMQSTTESTNPSILSTDETTPKNMQSTTKTTTPSISSTEKTTPKSMQSKISTPSISPTEEIPQNTMQSTKETTISSISTTLEPMTNPSTDQVSEETTTQQTTFKITEGTSTTTKESTQAETSTTQEKISNKDATITTPVIVTSPSIASTLKDTSKSSTTYKTPEMTTSSVTAKPADESTTSVATMLNDKTTTTSITQSTTKTVTVTDYVTPTTIDVTTRTTHKPFLSETTSAVSSAKTEVQSTITQNKETTTFIAMTDQTYASVKVSTMDDTTSRSTALPEDMTSTTTQDETTVSTSRMDTSSDKTSSVETTTSEVPSSKETTATLGNVPTLTPAYGPSSDGTSTSLTPSSVELNCTDTVEADLYSGPVTMECTIKKSEEFEYIGISYENGIANMIYGVLVYKNGTIFKTDKENQYISINIESTSTIKLIITFINVTCTMDGSYKVALISNISGEMDEVIGGNVLLKIRSPAGKPTLTLNADQVIDLVFPDGNYYRSTGTHTCEGLIGEPPARLEIDITYDNGTSFKQIPNSSIDLSRTNTSDECSTKETISFGLKFSLDMDGARLRCRVSDSSTDFTLSDELSLIPRNICSCGVSDSYRGHPSNCKVQVYCVEDKGVMYARGIACTSNQCRNSITGVCDTDCSDTVCNETVPSDFCTTPAPPTTTPAPSPYIVCTDTIALINSGSAVITCYLNDTATFTVMNVTYLNLGATDVQQIALIDDSNSITMFAMEDIVSISMSNNIINITILNPSCTNEGTFAVVTDINGESVKDHGKLSVISKPNGDATLQLHPDQIAGLGSYRTWLLHSCIINVGYPPGEISIEMMKQDDAGFTKLNVHFHTSNDDLDNTTCSITRTVKFGFVFTADMDKATMRCSVTHDLFPEDPFVYSNNETVSLIPIDFCKNNTDSQSYHPHQTNCHSFIQCEGDVTYGQPCPSSLCFGVTETNGCNFCDQAICPADITTTAKPETTVPVPSIDVSCTDSSVLLNSGPTDIVCVVNTTSFSMINVTFTKSSGVDPSLISRIEGDGRVIYTNFSDHIVVQYISSTVTITIQNVSCPYEGFYGVAVDSGNGLTGRKEGELSVTAKPSGPLDFKLHPEQIAGLNTVRSTKLHSCTGGVGNPGGKIGVEILLDGDDNFQTYEPSFKSITDTHENCTITREFKFWIAFTAAMNNATIKCKITNDKYQTDPPINSKNETLALVPHDFCNRNYNGTNRYHHPTDCNRYVTCVEKVGYVQACKQSLCFDPTIGACNFCETVNSCP